MLVIGDWLLKGAEGLICRPNSLFMEVCSLPGARGKDVERKLSTLIHLTNYNALMVFQVGNDETSTRSLRAMKKNFRTLKQMLKGIRSTSSICFCLTISCTWWGQQINAWLQDSCKHQDFGFFDHGLLYKLPGLLTVDRKCFSLRGKPPWGKN